MQLPSAQMLLQRFGGMNLFRGGNDLAFIQRPSLRTPLYTSKPNICTCSTASRTFFSFKPLARNTGLPTCSTMRRLIIQSCVCPVPPKSFTADCWLPESRILEAAKLLLDDVTNAGSLRMTPRATARYTQAVSCVFSIERKEYLND